MIVSSVLSTVASNTATTAALIPLVLSVCITAGIPASRLLMPMAFASGFGGISALIGTPPNVIVSEALREGGFRPFGFFEFAWVGIPMAFAGMLYMDLIGRRLLPSSLVSVPANRLPDVQPESKPRPRQMWVCGSILLIVVAVMALNLKEVPLEFVAVGGAVACVLTGCIGRKEAVESIEWETLILFGSMFAIAVAMDKSGASKMIAGGMMRVAGPESSGYLVVGGVLIVNMFMGLFLSNTVCAVFLAPIGLSLAAGIGANPHAILMTIA
ncbi:MAG: SLC13 family permease, partial [Fibrobacterota bacterium]|nr:SLC13 family permease [Fibrobacterota bacterium]